MKKAFLPLLLFALLPALAACGAKYDYTKHLSEVRSDIFYGETDAYSVTVFFGSREYPYATDGIACPMQGLAEISLAVKSGVDGDYAVYVLGDKEWGGEMSYRNVKGDYYYSQGVGAFPEGQMSLRIECEDAKTTLALTSVKTEDTLTPEEALEIAVSHEKETVARLTCDNVFQGEFSVRLLRRDANFYYVGIAAKSGKVLSLLLDAETGEVLARRENP